MQPLLKAPTCLEQKNTKAVPLFQLHHYPTPHPSGLFLLAGGQCQSQPTLGSGTRTDHSDTSSLGSALGTAALSN